MRRGEFIFNNINFFENRVRIQERPTIPKAERNETAIEIPGRNTPLTKWDGSYVGIEFDLSLVLKATDPDLAIEEFHWIAEQLQEPTYEFAKFYFDENYFYKVKFKELTLTYQTQYLHGVPFTAKVTCAPVKYNLMGLYPQFIQKNSVLYNLGGIEAKPLIQFEASGDVSFNLNGDFFTFKGLADGIYNIDSEAGEVYQILDGAYLSISQKYYNNTFPILKKGKNSIAWDGAMNHITITPRWGAIV